MGTDCAVIGKVKDKNKVFRHSLDRLYCFGYVSAGEYRHPGLKDGNPMEESGGGVVRTSDKIGAEPALLWAAIRLSFLYSHKAVLEKEIAFWYHVHWVGEFIGAVGALAAMSNIEYILLADDNCHLYDELVIFGNAEEAYF